MPQLFSYSKGEQAQLGYVVLKSLHLGNESATLMSSVSNKLGWLHQS